MAARETIYLRLDPDLVAEIHADRIAEALPSLTAACEAILRAGLAVRRAARGTLPSPAPDALALPVPRPPSYAATFGAAARIVFGLRGNEFDAEAVAFRLGGEPAASLADLPEVLRELCRLGLIEDLTASAPRGPGRPRKPKFRVTTASKDEAARLLADAARAGTLGGGTPAAPGYNADDPIECMSKQDIDQRRHETGRAAEAAAVEIAEEPVTRSDVLAAMSIERQGAIAARTAVLIDQEERDADEIEQALDSGTDVPEGVIPMQVAGRSPVRDVMAHLLAHSGAVFTAGEVADAVGIGIDEALTILRDMVDDDAVEKTRQSPSRTVYGLVPTR